MTLALMSLLYRKLTPLFAAALVAFFAAAGVARASDSDGKGFSLDQIGEISVAEDESAYDEIPLDHWVYKAIGHLAERGLMEEYDGEFRPSQPMTAYELALVVDSMFRTWRDTSRGGSAPAAMTPSFPEYEPAWDEDDSDETDEAYTEDVWAPGPSTESAGEPAAREITELIGSPAARLPHAQVVQTPVLQTVVRPGSGGNEETEERKPGEVYLTFSDDEGETTRTVVLERSGGPSPIEGEKKEEATTGSAGEKKEEPADGDKKDDKKEKKSKDKKEKDDKKKNAKDKKDDKKSKDKKGKEKKSKMPKELSELGEKFELEEKDQAILQALADYVGGQLDEMNDEMKKLKKSLEKDINEVRKVASSAEKDILQLKQENERFKVTGSAYSQIIASGETHEDDEAPYISNSTWASFGVYSKPRKSQDLVVRAANTSWSGADITYNNFEEKKGKKNFKVRSLQYGSSSAQTSALLSVAGTKGINGHSGEMVLNDYSLRYFWGNIGNYPQRVYGVALQSTLFGNQNSVMLMSRSVVWEDASVKDNCYEWTDDVDNAWGGWNGSTLCVPPFKNSITGVSIRYPIASKFLENVYFTAGFEHSTFYRQGFKMMYDEYCEDDDDCLGYETNFDIDNKYLTGGTGWRDIKELNDQDDAVAFMLDFTKGNLNVFPLGYIRLGRGYANRHMGLPGMDTGSFGLSYIPINLQSLEAYLARGTLDQKEDNFKWTFTLAQLLETQPMYLDLSALSPVAFLAVDKFRNRTNNGLIKVDLMMNDLTYYMTERINLTFSNLYARGGLGPDCLDGDLLEIKDAQGNVIDKVIGDGVAICDSDHPDDMPLTVRFKKKDFTYKMWVKTSNKSEYELEFNKNEMFILFDMGSSASAESVESFITDSIDMGTEYWLKNRIKYRLTDVANLSFWFNRRYGRPLQNQSLSDDYQSVGFELKVDI